jgi:hypothetical protein
VDTKKIVTIRSSSITSESEGGPAPQQEQQESGSIEVGYPSLLTTGFHPSWSSLCRLGICSGTNLRLRRLVPILYGIFELAGAQTQETEKLVIFWLQKK